ncbi:MAG: hypothetical protein H7251_18085 [Acetobacteraceae bacterium]|nr:hypothetical protein [Acetobacteraceae bacterium]
MIKRSDIVMLGINAAVVGSLVGGLMLGIGLGLVATGANIGWLLLLPAAPAAGMVGWLLGRQLAKRV